MIDCVSLKVSHWTYTIRLDSDQMSSLQPLANQEACIGCEHDSQISAVLSYSPSVLQVAHQLFNSIAHILTSAIYYDGADTNQIPASAPPQ